MTVWWVQGVLAKMPDQQARSDDVGKRADKHTMPQEEHQSGVPGRSSEGKSCCPS